LNDFIAFIPIVFVIILHPQTEINMDARIQSQFSEISTLLLQKRNAAGYWEGRLSSSALGVAVAITALHFHDAAGNTSEISSGLKWLGININTDGGFGDSPSSQSNVSTSLLCFAASKVTSTDHSNENLLFRLTGYLKAQKIDVTSESFIQAILDFYKTDRTFSVPILTMCALCGVPGKEAFERIPQLPFELSLLPRSFYSALNLSVVSYAIPALIGVGIAIFKHKQQQNPLIRKLRQTAVNNSLRLLRKIQPESGGYLEAIPLTAFVCLCLIESGYRDLDVVRDGISFLKRTRRSDGSWPIDIDLSTWVTTLAVKSVKYSPEVLTSEDKIRLTNHLLAIQNKQVHPFNGTQPGGWGWTSHSGSVPDGDDTPGTILALLALNQENPETVREAVLSGIGWLQQLQNKDGGFPTFSRGWGKLPFDQSCSDLTGHAILAMAKTIHVLDNSLSQKQYSAIKKMLVKALIYLEKHQNKQGFWLPLWFGNQFNADHTNPVYGTARVTAYLNETLHTHFGKECSVILKLMIGRGCSYLASVQNRDGSWGGAKDISGSIEETALSVTALVPNGFQEECTAGLNWLAEKTKSDGIVASPIGLYFASLWYDEELYPLTTYLECLSAVKETIRQRNTD
jgi:squalene-hopene/tetraprenyl-beta-curcumene cyclase